MSGKASTSQPSVGMSGLGGLSHIYIQYPPLRCSVSESKGLFYDDGNKLLICPTSDQVVSWKTIPFNPLVAPTFDALSEGNVLSVRYSLDGKLIAIQRSNNEIQFLHREAGETFIHRCRLDAESILGFFWTDCPLCDIVIVKTSGLDLFSYNTEAKSLRLVETKKLNVSWYVYTHESRLVLLASGTQCKTFTGFQLSSAGVIRLPKFEMIMAKSEANSKPVLSAEDVYVITVYGRIYCLQVDRVAMLLHCYRFYRDAVVQQGSLPIYSTRIAVSVVDNVLLVHQVDAKVVILYDIFSDSQAPISAPLPLLLRGMHRSNSSAAQLNIGDNGSSVPSSISDDEAGIYGVDWVFLVPDLIFDIGNKFLWKIHLDLEAISASSSEVLSVLEFLQRRKLEASKAKHLCLAIARSVILERRPVSIVAKALDVLVSSYSNLNRTGSYLKGVKSEKTSSSDVPHFSNPRPGAEVASGRIDAVGKSKFETAAVLEDKLLNKNSRLSTSDSDLDADFEQPKNILNNRQIHSRAADREKLKGTDFPNPEARSSSSNYQLLGLGNLLNDNDEESEISSPAISPDEIYCFVLAPIEEEIVGDPSYLVSIIIEFLRRANLEKIKLNPNIYVLTIQLLARNEQFTEIGLFVLHKILEPSKEVAFQLLESGRQNLQTRKLGLDMLRHLSWHHDYVTLLVQDGYYLEALRYVRKYKVDNVRPSLFLEAAFASNDSQHLAAVLRFFSDYAPSFKFTSDHERYQHILAGMTSSLAV